MVKLAVILASALVASPALLAAEVQTPAQHLAATIDIQDAWQFACAIMKAKCEEAPKVIVEPLYQDYGAFGVYSPMEGGQFPEDTVVLDAQLLPITDHVMQQAVLAHEMTHYIDHAYNGLDFADGCAAEWNGWRVMNAYVVSHGRPDLADYNWQWRYGCYGVRGVQEE